MLNQLSLRSRLLAVIAVAVLGMFTLALLAAFSTKQLLLEERKAQIRAVTQGVYNIVVHYHQLASAGKMTVEEAQEQAKIAIRQTRFNGPEGKSDYFYVWKPDGTNVVHALKPEWEGKPVGDSIKDGSGRLVIRELASQLANQNSTYLETVFIKSKDDPALYPKILYAQRFTPWE